MYYLDLLIIDDLQHFYIDDCFVDELAQICLGLYEKNIPILISLDRPLDYLDFTEKMREFLEYGLMVEMSE